MKFIVTTLFALALAGPSPVQQPVEADRSSRFDPRSSEGVFDVHVRVDGEVFLYVKGAEISHLIVSGSPLRLERSTYSQPIPEAEFGVFDLHKIDGRGRADLFKAPHRSNDYTAIIRINDDRGGPDLYHLRLNWTWNPDDPTRPPRVRDIRDDGWGGFPRIEFPGFYEPRAGNLEFRGRVDQITAITIRGRRVQSGDFAGRRSAMDVSICPARSRPRKWTLN